MNVYNITNSGSSYFIKMTAQNLMLLDIGTAPNSRGYKKWSGREGGEG